MGGRAIEAIQTEAMRAQGLGALERVTLGRGVTVDNAITALANRPGVVFAEPNWKLTAAAVSDDPLYATGSQLWGMYGDDQPSFTGPAGTTNAFGSQAEKAWAAGLTGSRTVYVGIVDEGVDFSHPDLAANMWVNPFEVAGDGIDNDGNGYADDIRGWDFYSNDATVYDGIADDHGTHVAGTIGGTGGNAVGVAGVNWGVTMIPTKFLGPNGGSTANAIKALDYLTDLKTRHGINIVVSNNSWGGGGYSSALHSAIIRGANAGILFVAAAGNSAVDTDVTANYPSNYSTLQATSTTRAAAYEAVISVAAISSGGALASFSNYGATTVDIAAAANLAPPVDIAITGGSVAEGNSGTTQLAFTVTLSAAADSTVTVSYATANGSATAGSDYAATSGILSFAAGETTKQIVVNVVGDTAYEGNETLSVTLSVPSVNARIVTSSAQGTITNDDPQPPPPSVPTLAISSVSALENGGSFVFTVTLSAASASQVTVRYATVNGTAKSGRTGDFTATSGTLTFNPGQTTKAISVAVRNDTLVEPDETFFVDLSRASGATIAVGRGTGTIRNDDGLTAAAFASLAAADSASQSPKRR